MVRTAIAVGLVQAAVAVGCAGRGATPASPVGWTPPRETPTALGGRETPPPAGAAPGATEPKPRTQGAEAAPPVEPEDEDLPAPGAGIAESQGRGHARVEALVAQATQQIERLRQLEGSERDVNATPRPTVESSRVELESRRERVLQDLRAFELEPVGRTADMQTQLERDLGDLKRAVDASYEIVPPPSREVGEPPPVPAKELP